jgi:hypothetical protein
LINKTDKSEWERLRQEHPPLEIDEVTSTADLHYTPQLNPTLFTKYIALAEEEQQQQDLSKSLWDDEDVVNSPDHYASGGIECIDAIEESMASYAFHGYLKGNCQKYLWRYEAKENPIQDLQKCRWYLDKLIATLEQEEYGEA